MKLKHILHYFGLFALLITTILGSLLLFGKDNVLLFIFGSIILVFVIYYLVKLLVAKREQTHQDKLNIILLSIIYLLIGGFSCLISTHFLTVQFGAFNDLKENGNEKIETIVSIQREFINSVNDLERDLTMEINNSLQTYHDAPRNSIYRQDKKNDLVNKYKFPESVLGNSLNNKNIPQTTANWIESNVSNVLDINILKNQNKKIFDKSKKIKDFYKTNKNVFNNTDYSKISHVYYELDTLLPKYKLFLDDKFEQVCNKYNLSNSALDGITIPKSKVQLNSRKGLWESYGSITYILIYLLIHFLILFPFFMVRREGFGPSFEEDHDTLPL